MNYSDRALAFDCHGDTLMGVLSHPEKPLDLAVLVVVGGPQYRVGSHRQFVLLSRALARAGYPVLRFDCRGMGDSSGAARSFETISGDIASALTAFERELPGVHRYALWGLCDGASAALIYVERTRDPRVAALCLANPWVRSETSLARTQVKHYYAQRLLQRQFWLKLLAGKVGAAAVRDLVGSVRLALRKGVDPAGRHIDARAADEPYPQVMARAWQRFPGRILLILSGKDYTAREFIEFVSADPAWQGALSRPGVERRDLADADHTFSSPTASAQVEARTLDWLRHAVRSTAPPATDAYARNEQ